ncbi:nucleoid-associated protein [Enterococcus faecalis]|jgi:hypothetical protein|uniref:nucleoid-associated protein n=1 Tax=Enterococcus sp. C78 TaxID=3231336 RepID=UPI001A0E60C5|nr:hypothetical protein [Enterococcus faecalis]HBE2201261.1 nucleoid-associated protein [Enterococcus faecalis]
MAIEISKMIVHKLNVGKALPILSDQCIDLSSLDNPDEALDFFKTHIEQSRSQGYVKKCQFWDLPSNTVKNNVETIISNIDFSDKMETVFIEESKEMAKKFSKLMRGTASRSDGSLFVLFYSVDGTNYIGIMKMDPDTGVEVIEKENNLTIQVRKDMLPSKREKLHKAAFIKCLDSYLEGETHLYALDRQKSSEEPAKYFLDSFLNAKIIPDDEVLTIAYQKAIFNVFQEVLPPNILMEFSQNFQKRLTEPRYFTLEDDFPPLIRDLLPENERDADLIMYMNTIQQELMRKHPGDVTGFMPVVEKVNNSVYRTINKSIQITIDKDADESEYFLDLNEEGELTLIIYPEANPQKIK